MSGEPLVAAWDAGASYASVRRSPDGRGAVQALGMSQSHGQGAPQAPVTSHPWFVGCAANSMSPSGNLLGQAQALLVVALSDSVLK